VRVAIVVVGWEAVMKLIEEAEKKHGPAAYVMLYVGATAKFVFSTHFYQKKLLVEPAELADVLTPNYNGIIKKEFEGKSLKVSATSRMKNLNSAILDMVRRELGKTPSLCERPPKSGYTTIKRTELNSGAPEALKQLWIFLGFIEVCVEEKFVWEKCKGYSPKGREWKEILKRLCMIANTSGNKAGTDNTPSSERMTDLPEIFESVFLLIVKDSDAAKKLSIGKISAALRATAMARDVETQFKALKNRGPYFIYRRARSSVTNQKTDIDIIVRDFIWLLPDLSENPQPVLGYYFSAFDEEVYEIRGIVVVEGQPSILKIDGEAVRSHGANKLLSLYVPAVDFGRTDTFSLGTIVGTLRDTHRTGGWSCVAMRPQLTPDEIQSLNTTIYSFLRWLSKPDVSYGTEIDRLRFAVENAGLAGVYTSRILEISYGSCEEGIADYLESSGCATERRKDMMACLCHDARRHKSVRIFVESLIVKHNLSAADQDPESANLQDSRIVTALEEAVFESMMSSTVPTAGYGEIAEVLSRSNGDSGLFGPDGIEIAHGTTGFHDRVTERLSNCTLRRTMPMSKYNELTKQHRNEG